MPLVIRIKPGELAQIGPDIFLGAERHGTANMVKLVIHAPKSLRILRHDLDSQPAERKRLLGFPPAAKQEAAE